MGLGYCTMKQDLYFLRTYKKLQYPVLGRIDPNQAGFFILYPNQAGYVENVFFLLGRAATPKKKSLIKSITILMSLGGNDFQGVNPLPVTNAHYKKIVLVIKGSKTVFFFKNIILGVLSFRFLNI